MATQKFTVNQIITAIEQAQTAAGAARVLGCNPQTIRNYANRYPTVAAALDGERNNLADYAEMGLKRAVLAGEPWALALALTTLRKGIYTKRQEITGADGGPMIVVNWDAADKD